MTAYDLMIKTTLHLIRGGMYSDTEKADNAKRLSASRATNGLKRTHNNPNWYPDFKIWFTTTTC